MELATEETHALISASKVDGTSVYGSDGDKIGSVDTLMIDKRGGSVAYAVLSVGGFLGIGDKHHSVPWTKLKYDENLGGYRLNVTEEQLKSAPSFEAREADKAFKRDYEERVYSHYDVPPYWI